MSDSVNRPDHYGGEDNRFEAIKIIEDWCLPFSVGNALKYILRAGKKGDAKEDLLKASWYLRRHYDALAHNRPCAAKAIPRVVSDYGVEEVMAGTGLDPKFLGVIRAIRNFNDGGLVGHAVPKLMWISKGYV